MNYITAFGYGNDEAMMDKWPASMHLVGKDILRFHAIYWPAFLMSLDLPLPKHICAHGWWTRDGEKMSKSKGNVVDPKKVADAYGLENFRYFMLREVPFGQDGDFSQRAFIDRINSDLSNDFGNLLNRIIGMSGKYSDFAIDSLNVRKYHANELDAVKEILAKAQTHLDVVQTHRYLEELWKAFTVANRAIEEHAPWVKMKEDKKEEALATVALVANILAKTSLVLHPVMPSTTQIVAKALGFSIDAASFERLVTKDEILEAFVIEKVPPLFPRVEEPLMQEAPAAMPNEPQVAKKEKKAEVVNDDNLITIDKFFETKLTLGTIVEVEDVPKSKRLWKLQVDVGEESPRQIVAGIKEFYSADELLNTQVAVVSNLKPAKLMGMMSAGMLLAVKDDNGLSLMRPEAPRKAGSSIG